jgi:hypothetical protein
MKSDGILCTGLLEATGGALELSKCFYYILSWLWDRKGNAIPNVQPYGNEKSENNTN